MEEPADPRLLQIPLKIPLRLEMICTNVTEAYQCIANLQGIMVSSGLLRRVSLVAACVVQISPIFVTLMKEAPGSSETSVLTRATWRNNPEDTILHSHRRENLKSYKVE
jgi:hypothetical protein